MLVPQTEEKLGKRLKTADLQILAGLYDDLGLPADVIYLLVCHCVTRSEERYGPGRRPTLRQIEKEAITGRSGASSIRRALPSICGTGTSAAPP